MPDSRGMSGRSLLAGAGLGLGAFAAEASTWSQPWHVVRAFLTLSKAEA